MGNVEIRNIDWWGDTSSSTIRYGDTSRTTVRWGDILSIIADILNITKLAEFPVKFRHGHFLGIRMRRASVLSIVLEIDILNVTKFGESSVVLRYGDVLSRWRDIFGIILNAGISSITRRKRFFSTTSHSNISCITVE